MIDSANFKSHFVGRDGFVWWIGQIPDETVWRGNIKGHPVADNTEEPGFGERYKVRIMGYHTARKEDLPDEELPWASVMYPTTAGGGGRGSYQNANLTQGCWVFGFFLDGDQCQTPVIMGCLGYNDYQAVMKNITNTAFIPFSGFTEKEKVATNIIRDSDAEEEVAKQSQDGGSEPTKQYLESIGGNNTRVDVSSAEMKKDGQKKEPLSVASDCEPVPTGKIQQQIKNLLADVEAIKRAKTEYKYTISKETTEFDGKIEALIKEQSKLIAGEMKWTMGQIQKATTEKVNTAMKDGFYNVMPNARQELKKEVETVNDLIACQFRKLINGLQDMIGNFLKDAVNKVVNATSCFIENMVGGMLGQIANAIENTLKDIFGSISSLTNVGAALPGGSILDIIDDVLSFLACDETPGCSQINELSLWDGGSVGSNPGGGMAGIANVAKSFSDKFNLGAIGGIASGLGSLKDNLTQSQALDLAGLDLKDIFGHNSCSTAPIACGPPLLELFGGKGTGATGNLIVSRLGEIMGVDMKSFGANYDSDVRGRVVDLCGKGRGGVIEPILGSYVDDNGNTQTGVVDINVVQPGIDYLGQPDGSTGGDGRTWARPDDTSITHANGDVEIPRPPGVVLSVVPGDTVLLPPGTVVTTEPITLSELTDAVDDTGVDDTSVTTIKIPTGEEFKDGKTTADPNLPQGTAVITEIVGGKEVKRTVPLYKTVDDKPIATVTGDEEIKGGVPYVAKKAGKFTTPPLPPRQPEGVYPTSSTGAYPVVLYLCDAIIDSPGYGYSPDDKIIIEPNVGALAVPKFNDMGSLISVKITAGGEGFTEMPDIYIKSDTGFNAVILPKFCIDRIAKDEVKEPNVRQDRIISIVDCVGKVPYPTPPEPQPEPTARAYSEEAYLYTPPPTPITTAADLLIAKVDDKTIAVKNPATGEINIITSKTGIDGSIVDDNVVIDYPTEDT